jgi:hypothetical protein
LGKDWARTCTRALRVLALSGYLTRRAEEPNLDLSRTPQGSQEPDRIPLRVALLPLGGSPPCELAQARPVSGRPEPHLSALVDARKSGARVGIPPSSHGSRPRTSGAICARMNSVWLGLRWSAPA